MSRISLVKNLDASNSDSKPLLSYAELNGYLYFTKGSYDSGDYNDELWRTDGTESGTTLIKEINTTSFSAITYPLK